MKISVLGTGHTKFGRSSRDIGDLMAEVCIQALENSNLDQIDAIYISNFSSNFTGQCHLPSVLASKLGISKEITRVESACASGGLALKEASVAILSGLYDRVLIVGVEKMLEVETEKAISTLAMAASKSERQHGATFPALFALMAKYHFREYGTTEEHLAKISVKNHKNALKNPLAQFHKEITVDDVLSSKNVASPLKILDCSPLSDGASAVLLSNSEIDSKNVETPVQLIGIGHDVEAIELYNRKNIATMPAVLRASKKAYKMCNLKPENVDVAEVHDCFTIAELIEIEDLGFCKKGQGKEMVDSGMTEVDGVIPINPSGGLKGKGHPVGATGISQVVEIVKQLRGDAGMRQVNNASVGLCCNIGGSGSTAIVSIFSR